MVRRDTHKEALEQINALESQVASLNEKLAQADEQIAMLRAGNEHRKTVNTVSGDERFASMQAEINRLYALVPDELLLGKMNFWDKLMFAMGKYKTKRHA